MYPILFNIDGFELHTYGLMMALAFAAGFALAVKRGKRYGFDFDRIYSTTIVIVLSSLAGSRAAYVIFHLEEFQGRMWDIINPIQSTGQIGISGMVVLGGVVSAFIITTINLKIKKISVGKMADTMAPSLALGLAIGRMGCFFNGCCFGVECHLPWGIVFPEGSWPRYIYGEVPVHPTQIYEVLYNLAIMAVLLKIGNSKKFAGFSFALFAVLYGFFRIIVESLRYYEDFESGMKVVNLGTVSITVSQSISFLMILAGIITIIIGCRRQKFAE